MRPFGRLLPPDQLGNALRRNDQGMTDFAGIDQIPYGRQRRRSLSRAEIEHGNCAVALVEPFGDAVPVGAEFGLALASTALLLLYHALTLSSAASGRPFDQSKPAIMGMKLHAPQPRAPRRILSAPRHGRGF